MTELAQSLPLHNQIVDQNQHNCSKCVNNATYIEVTGESFQVECEEIRAMGQEAYPCGLARLAVYLLAESDREQFDHLPPTAEEREFNAT